MEHIEIKFILNLYSQIYKIYIIKIKFFLYLELFLNIVPFVS